MNTQVTSNSPSLFSEHLAEKLDVLYHGNGKTRWYQWDISKLDNSLIGTVLWKLTHSISIIRNNLFDCDYEQGKKLLSHCQVNTNNNSHLEQIFQNASKHWDALSFNSPNSFKCASEEPQKTYLSDYKAPAYLIPDTQLTIDIQDGFTDVSAEYTIKPNTDKAEPLVLDGKEIFLLGITLNGRSLAPFEYSVDGDQLIILNVPSDQEFKLCISSRTYPEKNKSLSGLYQSRGIYCTQCESEGFRRIAYSLDRPDVISRYRCTIIADEKKCPVLLSNGNEIARSKIDGGRHSVSFEDPFPKPSYLFAIIAGNLASKEDHFTTKSGRKVTLRAFVEQGNENQVQFALNSLKEAMKWDEEKYGREYDLDILNMVGINDFNAGAMENKGLLVFNSGRFLADPNLTTDSSIEGVQQVVGHEYFHNWTGNRVTCRDWFQLCLKEGLTKFRDQEFFSDHNSRDVKRINDVNYLRNIQFIEDAGGNAHPIQPDSYVNISNFYTATVYRKGAEIYRMLQKILGVEGFRRGTDQYFDQFDGKSATLEDFISCMELANTKVDLSQFRNWVHQAGTPQVEVTMDFEQEKEELKLHVKQSCRPTKETKDKKPFLIPLSVAFFSKEGEQMELKDSHGLPVRESTLIVKEAEETFVFTNVKSKPIPSLLRSFSAPVNLHYEYSIDELAVLLAHDSDGFNRYDSGQRMAQQILAQWMEDTNHKEACENLDHILSAFEQVLENSSLENSYKAVTLSLPTVASITENTKNFDFSKAYEQKNRLIRAFAEKCESTLLEQYESLHASSKGKDISAESRGKRSLKNVLLGYLASFTDDRYQNLIEKQFFEAENMSDRYSALSLLCRRESEAKDKALKSYQEAFKNSPEAMELWFSAQSTSPRLNVLDDLKKLEKNPAFDQTNPNKARSLYFAFAANLACFHSKTGDGYAWIADKIIEIDRFNSHLAARLSTVFKKYPQLNEEQKQLMKQHLDRVLNTEGLSETVYEIIANTIKES